MIHWFIHTSQQECKELGNHASFHGFLTIGNISFFCVFTFPSFCTYYKFRPQYTWVLKKMLLMDPILISVMSFIIIGWMNRCCNHDQVCVQKCNLFGLRNLRECNTLKINRLSSFLLKQSFIVLYTMILDGFLRWWSRKKVTFLSFPCPIFFL